MKTTTITLSTSLFTEAKIKCLKENRTFSDYIRQLIEEDLNKKSTH